MKESELKSAMRILGARGGKATAKKYKGTGLPSEWGASGGRGNRKRTPLELHTEQKNKSTKKGKASK